jgi:hypothetical protein
LWSHRCGWDELLVLCRSRWVPGLQYAVSTGRLHGFESLQKAMFLMALDFAGQAVEVLSQPMRLTF